MDLIGSSIIGIVVGLIVAIALRRQKKKDTPEEDKEKTFIATMSTELDWDITDDIEYTFAYDIQAVSRAAGGLIHHLKTGIEIELIKDFDIKIPRQLPPMSSMLVG
jgi:hypothetical protein